MVRPSTLTRPAGNSQDGQATTTVLTGQLTDDKTGERSLIQHLAVSLSLSPGLSRSCYIKPCCFIESLSRANVRVLLLSEQFKGLLSKSSSEAEVLVR